MEKSVLPDGKETAFTKFNRVVITGGAGYLGSALCHFITSKMKVNCDEIHVYDNLFYNQGTLVSKSLVNDRVSFFKESVLDWSDNLKESIKGADVIIPLAALVGAPLCDKNKELAYNLNYKWYEQLLPYLENQVVIYPNTNSGYGTTGDGVCNEETPTNPLSLYAKTKDDTEKLLLSNYNRTVAFRLATVFGTSFRTRTDLLVNNLVKRAMEDGSISVFDGHFRRNYIHVKDICSAFTFAMNYWPLMIGNVYNLGNDAINTTKLTLVQQVCRQTNASFTHDDSRTDPDKRDYVVSSQKLYDLGYEAKVTLTKGIDEMKKFYSMFDASDDQKCRNY